jgi:hypothetical protein
MSPEFVQLLSSGGAGVAVIVVTLVFLRYLNAERQQLMADRREERREFLQRLEQVSGAIADLNTVLWKRPCLRDAERKPQTQKTAGSHDSGRTHERANEP